jgi:hypothetical protein
MDCVIPRRHDGDSDESNRRRPRKTPENSKEFQKKRSSGDSWAFVVVRGSKWPVCEKQQDLFMVADLNGGGRKGWLISERFQGMEAQEVVTDGPLRAEGTWWWMETRNWLELHRHIANAFLVKISDKRIVYEGPMPESKKEAEDTFWEETGLRREEWKLVWEHCDSLVARLMGRSKKEIGKEKTQQA